MVGVILYPTMQARFWLLTHFLIDEDDLAALDGRMRAHSRGGIYQVEVANDGFPHVQGYLEFDRTRRLAYLRAHISNTGHWEQRQGSREEAVAYCSKDDTRVAGPFEYGHLDICQGRRSDLANAIAALELGGIPAVLEEFPREWVKFNRGLTSLMVNRMEPRLALPLDKPEVWLLHGGTGTGKTRRAYELAAPGTSYPKDPNNKWWDGYCGQETVIIDDYTNCSMTGLTTDYMLRILDMYPMMLEVKGATCPMARSTRKVVITSNLTLKELWPTAIAAMTRRIDHVIEFV